MKEHPVCLIEQLINCGQRQKTNYDVMNEVIKKTENELNFEETDNNKIQPAKVNLKFLEIYRNYIMDKNEGIDNNSYSFALNSNIDENIKMAKTLEIKDFVIDSDIKRTNTLNSKNSKGNQHNKETVLRNMNYMIKTLNRAEILKIFEKIKSTNILISESDLKLIEQETDYNNIHEQLTIIFNNTEKYKEKNRDILMKLLEKNKGNIFFFIKVLNDHRSKGNFFLIRKYF